MGTHNCNLRILSNLLGNKQQQKAMELVIQEFFQFKIERKSLELQKWLKSAIQIFNEFNFPQQASRIEALALFYR